MGNEKGVCKTAAGGNSTERVDVDISFGQDPYNDFYGHVSTAFRILSFVFLASFLIYIVFTAFNNAGDFSYDNFEYILRNFALTLEENKDDSLYAVEYNPDVNRSFQLFGKGISVCGQSGISIYSSTGRLTCSESFSYKEPRLASSSKFALVYDHSGLEYSLYNSFSKVYSDKLDVVIRDAEIADNGYYALMLSSDQYNTAVELYDDTFSLTNRINKIGYTVDIDINDSLLVIASASVSDSNSFITELQVFDYNEQREIINVTAEDNFPLKCSITSDGFILVGTNATVFYNADGSVLSVYKYDGMAPYDFSVNGDGVVLLFKDSGFDIEYRAVVFDKHGESTLEKILTTTVFDVDSNNGWLYYLTEGSLICTNGSDVYDFSVKNINERSNLLSLENGGVYVCTDTSAPLFMIPQQ